MKNRFIRVLFRAPLLLLSVLAVHLAWAQSTTADVVVTASRTEQILTDALPHTTVLGRDAIAQSQLLDLPSLLAREAGFQFTQSGGRGSQSTAFLRGAASLQVLVLVDGVPMTKQDTTGAVSLEHIMLDQVDRIEILRGNVSAIHGSGAVGGVIQVFTRQGQAGQTAYVKAEMGSLDSTRLSLGTQGKQGDLGYAVSLGKLSTQGINAANLAQSVNANPDTDGYRNQNHSVHLSYDLGPDHKVGWRSTRFKGRFDYDVAGSFALPTDVHNGTSQIDSNTVYWAGKLGPTWTSRLNYSDAKERNTTSTLGGYSFSTLAQTRNRWLSWTHQLNLAALVLTAGVDHQVQGIESGTDGVNDLTRQRTADAVYAGMVYDRGSHSAQFNLRHDRVEKLASEDSFYLGYGYALDPQWKLIASHATAFNVPPLGYLFDPYSGNPDLRPETANTSEMGVQWANGSHRLRSTLFDTRTKDLMLYDMTNGQFSNVSSAKNQGLETSYNGRVQNTDLRASVTLQNPVNLATGLRLVRRAMTLASLSVSRDIGVGTLGGHLRYTGKRPDISGKPNLNSSVLLDLTARYALSPGWTLLGRIENVTDRPDQSAYGYNALPRTFYLGLNWAFKS